MPGFNPDKLNIHELTIEEPEKETELPFDMERDFVEGDLDGMKLVLENFKETRQWENFLMMAEDMKILMPDSKDVIFTNEALSELRNYLEREKEITASVDGDQQWDEFIDKAAAFKIINPAENFNFGVDIYERICKVVNNYKRPSSRLKVILNARIIFPEKKMPFDIEKLVGDELLEIEQDKIGNDMDWFSEISIFPKILSSTKNVEISQDKWRKMKDILVEYRNSSHQPSIDWSKFSHQAALMKILSAEEVKVTDQGLEINIRKSSLAGSGTPQMPEQRTF